MKNVRPRGRPLSFDRELVLSKAAEYFWAHGYEGTSIADLTKVMCITPQSLYTAFNSKADLYQEALDWYTSTFGGLEPEFLDKPNVVETLAYWLQKQAKVFTSSSYPRGCMLSIAALGCATENMKISRLAAEKRQATIQLLRGRLERAVSENELKPNTNPAALARFIGAVIQGMTVQARDGATASELNEIALFACKVLYQARATME